MMIYERFVYDVVLFGLGLFLGMMVFKFLKFFFFSFIVLDDCSVFVDVSYFEEIGFDDG